MLSGFFDKTKIRRPQEYGKYNAEVTVKNLCLSFCRVFNLNRCDYSYGPWRKNAEKSSAQDCVDRKMICQC